MALPELPSAARDAFLGGHALSLRNDPIPLHTGRFALWTLCVSWVGLIAWWHRRVVIDDPWITYQYSRHLAEGVGIVFNPGERIEGFSNPLWMLLHTIPHWLYLEPLSFSRFVSFVLLAALLWVLIMGWTPRALRSNRTEPTITRSGWAAVLVAISASVGVWTMGGLETIQHTVLLTAFVLALAHAWSNPVPGVQWLAGALGGALVLSRPEGFGFLPLALLPVIARLGRGWGPLLLLPLMVILGATLFRWFYFGELLPNTVAAKVGGGVGGTLLRGLHYVFANTNGLYAATVLFGAFALVLARRSHGVDFTIPALALTAAAMQYVFVLLVGGDWMPGGRFLVPAVPLLALAAGFGLRSTPLFVRLVFVSVLFLAELIDLRRDPVLRWSRWAAKEQDALLVEPLKQTGRWLARNTPPNALVAGTEAGVIPYYARRPFLDMVGLVDRHIAELEGELHYVADPNYVLTRRPDYVVLGMQDVDGALAPQWPTDRALFEHPSFATAYVEVHRVPRPMPTAELGIAPGYAVIYRRRS
jgi:hypothetical protein